MSGTGKSSALAELRKLGFEAIDTDYVWNERRTADLLARDRDVPLYVSGTVSNQGRFYPQFDAVVLLSAPAEALVDRLADRSTNDYGKTQEERELILEHLETVEPLLRATCTHELDASQPLDEVVAELARIGGAP